MRSRGSVVGIVVMCLLFVGIGIAAVLVPNAVIAGWKEEESVVAREISDRREKGSDIDEVVATQQADVTKTVSGYDAERAKSDCETIKSFLSTVCSWESCEEYDAAREKAMKEFGVAKDSQFMTDYMPYVAVDSVGGGGRVMKGGNRIDASGLSLELGGADSTLTSMDGRIYGYVTLFDVHPKGGNKSDGSDCVLICKVDSDGILTDVYACEATVF